MGTEGSGQQKITMREAREESIKMEAKWLAEADQDIAKHFESSKDDSEALEKTDFATNTGERNNRLFRLIKKMEVAQKLFAKRQEALDGLLKEVKKYTGKDMVLLKEQLGMVKPEEVSIEVDKPLSTGEME